MIIKDNVGEIKIQLGEPSSNHIRISGPGFDAEHDMPIMNEIDIHIAQWHELKKKIDKMFSLAFELEKP